MPTVGRAVVARLFLIFACFVLAVLSGHAQSAEVTQRGSVAIKATLSLPKTTFVAGEAIPAAIAVTNTGSVPVLLGNRVLRDSNTRVNHIDFRLKDAKGGKVPETTYAIFHMPGAVTEPRPAVAFVRNLILLYPRYSISTVFRIGTETFEALGKPGLYTLYAVYSASGLSYPGVLDSIGVTEAQVKALPFRAYLGKVQTNGVSFRILPPTKVPRHKQGEHSKQQD